MDTSHRAVSFCSHSLLYHILCFCQGQNTIFCGFSTSYFFDNHKTNIAPINRLSVLMGTFLITKFINGLYRFYFLLLDDVDVDVLGDFGVRVTEEF